ncbi:hypothetical protein ASPVEDRAFT_89590 [Aspergillus versicolor CBS 583.65]|uniref:Uncharacterized protein n=1 Tax=Aspergillus versicolor CBS 583.65 TaxID=1036611 RepID=A0A1L9Q3K9_ASPVE|nr:uncharacterized protein ASPVEDRAFT_89590 [Aspergillus versicolor CBS 583.65]OJJ08365.1 hypothetical protein ASPVEDRAFT_89590 [Aspergillus versicolor CBS 583.65]
MPPSLASSGSSQSDNTKTSPNSISGKSDELAPSVSLGGIQHLDRQGKVISDPDRSNPTRPRLERPLDTIRGFEAAINARRPQRIVPASRMISEMNDN